MGFELVLIAAGITLLIAVLARTRLFERRLIQNKEKLENLRFGSELPTDIEDLFKNAPKLKGDGKYAYQAVGTLPFKDNYEAIRVARRIIYIEPTPVEVLLIPEPGNYERKLAVAITIDAKLVGYVPTNEATEMHKYLLAHSTGLIANAKIYLGSRPEFNALALDFAKPLRLESGKR